MLRKNTSKNQALFCDLFNTIRNYGDFFLIFYSYNFLFFQFFRTFAGCNNPNKTTILWIH